jgi:hypothetical protein
MTARDAIADEWFARTLESYPEVTARFVATEKDPFRNPVGNTLRSAMAALVAELLGEMNAPQVRAALDSILQIRAVQDFTPGEAVAFVFLLRPILLAHEPSRPAMLESRIDQLTLAAFDAYMHWRERIAEVRAQERRRRSGPRRA